MSSEIAQQIPSLPEGFAKAVEDWGQEDGISWVTVRAPAFGAVNGYVQVPEDHPWHGLDYDSIPQDDEVGPTYIDVHGGLTYARGDWVGFDTLHAGDRWPDYPAAIHGFDPVYDTQWTPELVAEEARSLARQIAAAYHGVMRHPILSVDLDSTLADTRHRRGIIEGFKDRGEPIDWSVYAGACAQDEPTGFARLLLAIQDTVPWVVVSGRSEGSREATEAWLAQHGLRPEAIYLEDDPESHSTLGHAEWKSRRVLGIKDMHPTIAVHVDDWGDIADMLGASGLVEGLTVLPPGKISVVPGDNPPDPTAL